MVFKLFLPKFWYHKGIISYLLLPFSFIYYLIIRLRRFYWRCFPGYKFPVPIIVVGNITVGGTGKTPLVIFLANLLQEQGYRPGIVTRGYGGKSKSGSIVVSSESEAVVVGDEALLISRRVSCPVIVNANRVVAVKELLGHGCDLIISDDGLQHYTLARDLEIVLINAEFKFGNEFCLPAGPLREPLSRLNEVDFVVRNFNTELSADIVVDNGYSMVLEPIIFRNVANPSLIKTIDEFNGMVVHGVAGIGIPDKFFQTLNKLGMSVIEHSFPDHYSYSKSDLMFDKEIVVMTEKDAVKCDRIAGENFWYIEVAAKPSREFADNFLKKVEACRSLYL